MTNLILAARLEALNRDLRQVLDSVWLKDLELGRLGVDDKIPDLRWIELELTIGKEAERQSQQIQELEKSLTSTPEGDDISNLWRKYRAISRKSEELFSEFLEFIGALAFRDRGIDQQICRIADELVRKCSMDTTGNYWKSVTVPTRAETGTDTLARIIRLRFPEHPPVWALPLAAHAYGHGIPRESNELKTFLTSTAEAWSTVGIGRRKMKKTVATLHLRELNADAFATYYMGPAYAAAAHYLRFDPLGTGSRVNDRPSHLARSHVILTMLERLTEESEAIRFEHTLTTLRNDWESMRRCVGATRKLDVSEQERLTKFVDAAHCRYESLFRTTARYSPGSPNAGWTKAQTWMDHWHSELKASKELTVPADASAFSSLRDALNAAWLLRMENPDPSVIAETTDVALQLCNRISAK